MYLYRGFSLIIGSELALPELPGAEGKPDVVIRVGSVPRIARRATVSDELSFHRTAGAFHIRDGHEIVVDPLPGVDLEVVQVLLLGRIMAYLLRQRGWLPLHASAVIVNGEAVLFSGASGSGKSTAAAAFHSMGHQVIADDVAAVRVVQNRCIMLPGRSRLRLLDDSLSLLECHSTSAVFQWDKYLVDVSRGALPDAVQVKRIYLIADGDEMEAQPLAPAPAVKFLSENSFIKRRRVDTACLRMHLRDCAAVAGTSPVLRLTRPRGLSGLHAMVRFVERDLAGNG